MVWEQDIYSLKESLPHIINYKGKKCALTIEKPGHHLNQTFSFDITNCATA